MPGSELSQWCLGANRRNTSCGDSYLNWTEIQAINASGLVEIGSHTTDHAQLNDLDANAKRNQIMSAKHQIEQYIGQEVVSFAYPYGAYDTTSVNLVREAGYTSAVSTAPGTMQSNNTLFELKRIRSTFELQ